MAFQNYAFDYFTNSRKKLVLTSQDQFCRPINSFPFMAASTTNQKLSKSNDDFLE